MMLSGQHIRTTTSSYVTIQVSPSAESALNDSMDATTESEASSMVSYSIIDLNDYDDAECKEEHDDHPQTPQESDHGNMVPPSSSEGKRTSSKQSMVIDLTDFETMQDYNYLPAEPTRRNSKVAAFLELTARCDSILDHLIKKNQHLKNLRQQEKIGEYTSDALSISSERVNETIAELRHLSKSLASSSSSQPPTPNVATFGVDDGPAELRHPNKPSFSSLEPPTLVPTPKVATFERRRTIPSLVDSVTSVDSHSCAGNSWATRSVDTMQHDQERIKEIQKREAKIQLLKAFTNKRMDQAQQVLETPSSEVNARSRIEPVHKTMTVLDKQDHDSSSKKRSVSEQLVHNQEAELKRLKQRLGQEKRGFHTTTTADLNFDTLVHSPSRPSGIIPDLRIGDIEEPGSPRNPIDLSFLPVPAVDNAVGFREEKYLEDSNNLSQEVAPRNKIRIRNLHRSLSDSSALRLQSSLKMGPSSTLKPGIQFSSPVERVRIIPSSRNETRGNDSVISPYQHPVPAEYGYAPGYQHPPGALPRVSGRAREFQQPPQQREKRDGSLAPQRSQKRVSQEPNAITRNAEKLRAARQRLKEEKDLSSIAWCYEPLPSKSKWSLPHEGELWTPWDDHTSKYDESAVFIKHAEGQMRYDQNKQSEKRDEPLSPKRHLSNPPNSHQASPRDNSIPPAVSRKASFLDEMKRSFSLSSYGPQRISLPSPQSTNENSDSPMVGDVPDENDRSESIKRKAVELIMKDSSLTPQEKRTTILEVLASDGKSPDSSELSTEDRIRLAVEDARDKQQQLKSDLERIKQQYMQK